MKKIEGREFSDEIITRIINLLEQQPHMSRRQLSLKVCEWMQWRNAAGRLQEMSCRKALLQLHRAGIIELPAVSRTFAFQKPSRVVAPPPITPVDGLLGDLGGIELVRVVRGALSPVWRVLNIQPHGPYGLLIRRVLSQTLQ